MTCAACANSVESMLGHTKGVQSASVNFAANTVNVAFDESETAFPKMREALQAIGYDIQETVDVEKQRAEKAAALKTLRQKVWVAAIFSIPVFLMSMVLPSFPYDKWAMLALALPVILYSGREFYVNAWKKLMHWQFNMDTLIALGTGAAFIFSLINTFIPQFLIKAGLEPHVYYESAVVIITLILFGNYLEEKAKSNTSSAIEKLLGLQAKKARIVENGEEREIPIDEVQKGAILSIKPGEKVPVDGIVEEGSSYLDESMVTGEPEAVRKEAGANVIGGTINQQGHFLMKAQKVGAETMLSQIIHMVQEAQGTKAPAQKLADKISAIFVPTVISIAAVAFLVWYIVGPDPAFTNAFVVLITVLIIACPCALGLATPTAITVGIGRGANEGILIKDAETLERAREISMLLVDKTGTLTEGKPRVVDWQLVSGKEEVAAVVQAMESKSEHPLGQAVVRYLVEQNMQKVEIEGFESITAQGVKATYKGKAYRVGKPEWTGADQAEGALKEAFDKVIAEGKTVIGIAEEDRLVGFAALEDPVKQEAKAAVKHLQDKGIKVVMLTGDNEKAAARVAEQVGIDDFHAKLLPEDKVKWLDHYHDQGYKVAMAGDGINDAPALAKAEVGLAMSTGTDVAIESAGITLLKGDISKIAEAILLSRKTVGTIRGNLFWAFFYNVLAIPIAAGVLYPINGFLLNPMIAGGAMAFSSLSVVMNSLLLKRR